MNSMFLTLIAAFIAVGFLMLSLLITYFRKGHHIQSEIGDNPDMKKRGINCTSRQILEEEREIFGTDVDTSLICSGSCGTCTTVECEKQ